MPSHPLPSPRASRLRTWWTRASRLWISRPRAFRPRTFRPRTFRFRTFRFRASQLRAWPLRAWPLQASRTPGPALTRPGTLAALLFGLLLGGCGGEDFEAGAADSPVQRLMAEAEAEAELREGAPATPDFRQPRESGWTLLAPSCEFPLRLQVPEGWDLDEGETRSVSLTLRREGEQAVALMISMIGGSLAVEDRMRGLEADDASVRRLREVTYGSRSLPIHGGPDGQMVIAYPPVEHVAGPSVRHAVVRVSAIWDYEGNPVVDEATLTRLAATLEPNDC